MLSTIAAITIPILLMLFVAFFVFENNRKKRLAELKQQLNNQVNDAKLSYKIDIETFCEETRLPNVVRDRLYVIANNFFVYQSINEENVAIFELSIKKLSQSFSNLLKYFNSSEDLETVHERIELFLENLPTQPRGYNAVFYQTSLTTLNHLLEVPEKDENQDTQVDTEFSERVNVEGEELVLKKEPTLDSVSGV